jgi:hypothetical protein
MDRIIHKEFFDDKKEVNIGGAPPQMFVQIMVLNKGILFRTAQSFVRR